MGGGGAPVSTPHPHSTRVLYRASDIYFLIYNINKIISISFIVAQCILYWNQYTHAGVIVWPGLSSKSCHNGNLLSIGLNLLYYIHFSYVCLN